MGDAERLADTVLLVMRTELAPMRERMIGLVERNAALQTEVITLRADVGQLRERVAVAEARPGPPGPAGADGKDGAAGVTADALTVTQDGEDERVITFGVKAGDTVTSWGTVRLTLPRYCGVYDTARTYTAGDQVTHAGSLWSCTATTNMRPGGGGGWVLQVKQGKG